MSTQYLTDRPEDKLQYPYLSPEELIKRLEDKAILYLPIGSLEWHNEHLPLGTDTFHAIELSKRLCAEIGGIVLPAFWWNTGECHDHLSTYHMPEELYLTTLKNVCLGLKPIPSKLLVLINGHGGNYQRDTPAILAEELNKGIFPMRVVIADPYGLGKSSSCRIDHADTGETSFYMELIPQLVHMERKIGPDIRSGKKPFVNGKPNRKGGKELWQKFFLDAAILINDEYNAQESTE